MLTETILLLVLTGSSVWKGVDARIAIACREAQRNCKNTLRLDCREVGRIRLGRMLFWNISESIPFPEVDTQAMRRTCSNMSWCIVTVSMWRHNTFFAYVNYTCEGTAMPGSAMPGTTPETTEAPTVTSPRSSSYTLSLTATSFGTVLHGRVPTADGSVSFGQDHVTRTVEPAPSSVTSRSTALAPGSLAGILTAAILLLLAVIVTIGFILFRRRRSRSRQSKTSSLVINTVYDYPNVNTSGSTDVVYENTSVRSPSSRRLSDHSPYANPDTAPESVFESGTGKEEDYNKIIFKANKTHDADPNYERLNTQRDAFLQPDYSHIGDVTTLRDTYSHLRAQPGTAVMDSHMDNVWWDDTYSHGATATRFTNTHVICNLDMDYSHLNLSENMVTESESPTRLKNDTKIAVSSSAKLDRQSYESASHIKDGKGLKSRPTETPDESHRKCGDGRNMMGPQLEGEHTDSFEHIYHVLEKQ